jgi:hypothetical protein
MTLGVIGHDDVEVRDVAVMQAVDFAANDASVSPAEGCGASGKY